MKIVVNACFGGFSLSHEGCMRYLELAGKKVWLEENKRFKSLGPTYWLVPQEERQPDRSNEWSSLSLEERQAINKRSDEESFYCRVLERNDPILVRVVEELGERANGEHAELRITEIPDDVEWEIDEYDGREHVSEKHRTW